jgi:hypothetical protein
MYILRNGQMNATSLYSWFKIYSGNQSVRNPSSILDKGNKNRDLDSPFDSTEGFKELFT